MVLNETSRRSALTYERSRLDICALIGISPRFSHHVQMSSWAYIMYIVMDSAGVTSFLYFIALVLLQAYFVVGLLVVRVEGGAYDSGVLACAWGCMLGRRCVIGGKLKIHETCTLTVPCSVVLGPAALPDQAQMPATGLPLMPP